MISLEVKEKTVSGFWALFFSERQYMPATIDKVSEAMTAWKKAYALGPETDVGKAAKGFMENN